MKLYKRIIAAIALSAVLPLASMSEASALPIVVLPPPPDPGPISDEAMKAVCTHLALLNLVSYREFCPKI